MMRVLKNIFLVAAIVALFMFEPTVVVAQGSRVPRYLPDSVASALTRVTLKEVAGCYVKVKTIKVLSEDSSEDASPILEIRASEELAYFPMRKASIESLYSAIREELPSSFADYELRLYAGKWDVESLVPRYYDEESDATPFTNHSKAPLLRRVSNISQPSRGLLNRHIALWQSHGRYFNNNTGEWSWQRSRLWETVEDLYTQSYVIPFLLPMLERAGATVLLPRERSMRREEIIIDNDEGVDQTTYSESGSWSRAGEGFAHLRTTYTLGQNPFKDGSARMIATVTPKHKAKGAKCDVATWSAAIPESGLYTLYISYFTHKHSVRDAHYTVHASGGDREFFVNQRMGGGMWIALGEFYFEAGNEVPLVTLDNSSESVGVVTADAVKIGGGMGNVCRGVDPSLRKEEYEYESAVSGYPRFTEGACYWLQWSGFSTDVYAPKGGADDYMNDYMSRPRWVNALMGGSERRSGVAGKSIPLDVALAFHSDAGARLSDRVVGTLGIYCTRDNNSKFEDDISRLCSRDLTDIVMTQIVEDLRHGYDRKWVRRGMWDKSYYEARLPWCPTMLLELLSHQNFADMRLGLDPQFRFDVSRAIYKGVLRYLSSQYGVEYVVQPLPVNNFAAELNGRRVRLSWSPTVDLLEPTATPDYYVLYTRVGDGGFDSGRRVDATSIELEQEPDKIYSYRVTAVNEGGESFDSETLAAAIGKRRECVLVVNGFDRVAAPVSYRGDKSVGFYNCYDSGVAYIEDISFIGEQVNFNSELYKSLNDNNALGQSYNDFETEVIAGNSFDFVALHGRSILAAGYSFASASHSAVQSGTVTLADYEAVDLILGKQRTTPVGAGEKYRYEALPSLLQTQLQGYVNQGGSLMISGSYLLSDLWQSPTATEADRKFAEEVLHVSFGGAMATRRGEVKGAGLSLLRALPMVKFNTELNGKIYSVESPEVVTPAGSDAYIAMRYRDTNQSAAVAYNGSYRSLVLGFPFETIVDGATRDKMMDEVLAFLIK